MRIAAHGNDFGPLHLGEHAAAHAAVAARRRNLDPRLDHHVAVLHPGGVDRDAHRAVLQAAAAEEAEVLLVDRRGDDQLAVQVAHDAARENVRTREGIAVSYGVDFFLHPEDRHLLAADQRANADVWD